MRMIAARTRWPNYEILRTVLSLIASRSSSLEEKVKELWRSMQRTESECDTLTKKINLIWRQAVRYHHHDDYDSLRTQHCSSLLAQSCFQLLLDRAFSRYYLRIFHDLGMCFRLFQLEKLSSRILELQGWTKERYSAPGSAVPPKRAK